MIKAEFEDIQLPVIGYRSRKVATKRSFKRDFRMTEEIRERDSGIPLCVDLDGTLVCTDLLLESIFKLFKQNILYIFLLPLWLLNGKAHFKQQIADRVDLDVGLLPIRDLF